MNILQQAARRPERLEAFDKVAKPGAGAVGRAWCATCTAWEQRRTSGRRCWPTPNWPMREHHKADAGGVPILLYRTAGTVYAWTAPALTWAARCRRFGTPSLR
jgi:hypothetical protein